MPELPEVQTVVTTLHPHVVGRAITRVYLHRPDVLRPPTFDWSTLHGRVITHLARRGKKIVFTLDAVDRFVVHLGMTGRLSIAHPDEPLKPHTHCVIELPNTEVRFVDPRRFGGIWWLGHTESPDHRLGPEPLTLRTAILHRQLSRTKRAIKNALLDQSVVAGLGNIYVDEALHTAGIHPLTIASHLPADDIIRLNRAIKSTLKKAIHHRGSTLRDYRDANGATGGFQLLHNVYARTGHPCSTCKTRIERIVLGGRSTHFCPTCQK